MSAANDPALLGYTGMPQAGINAELGKVRGESTLSSELPLGRQYEVTSSAQEQALSGQIAGVSIGTLLILGVILYALS